MEGTALVGRTIILEKNYNVPEEFYFKSLSDVENYPIVFPNYVHSIQLKQDNLGNFAEIDAGRSGINVNIQMQYYVEPKEQTFSAVVIQGEYTNSMMTTVLTETTSFDGKNPVGATKVYTELILHYSIFSPIMFIDDNSIRTGLEQALDKFGERAIILQKKSNM